jgi:hypothetical protein
MSDINVTVQDQIVNVDVQDETVLVEVANAPGPQGPQGPQGPAGANGAGVPVGGTTGQVLAKASGTNYDTQWVNQSGGGAGTWGSITGTLSNQTDLQNALNAKFDDPTGTTAQYLRGDGSLATFPSIPTGTVSSVGISMPGAFAVANSPITSSGTIAVTGAGDTTQYIAGDGSLVAFPITGQAGTLVREVRNVTGATLTKGTVVYINGASGNRPTVAKALATSDPTSAQTFGLIQADIPNNSNGYLVAFGDLDGLNTSAFAEGSQLYLSSTTAGAYTTTKQYAPNHLVYIGVVTRQHVNQGRIEVRIQNGYEMDELHDVAAQNPSNNDGLFYNTTNSLWENKSIPTALGFTPVTNARTLTINGVTQDLSANRSWTVDSILGVDHLMIGASATINFDTYNNGASGVGAYLCAINALPGDEQTFTINGNTVVIGDTILVTGRIPTYENGLYYFDRAEVGSDNTTPYLVRLSGYDSPSEFNNSILVQIRKRTFPNTANVFVGSITNVTTIGTSEILFCPVDDGRTSGTNANLPAYPLTGQTYFQTDGTSGQYVYNGTTWDRLVTRKPIVNYFVQHLTSSSYSDSTTYYFGSVPNAPTTTQGLLRGIFNQSGTIKSIYLFFRSIVSPTTEVIAISLWRATGGGTLSQIASTTFSWPGSTSFTTLQWTGLNIAISANQTYEFKIDVPNMAANPTSVLMSGNIEVELT